LAAGAYATVAFGDLAKLPVWRPQFDEICHIIGRSSPGLNGRRTLATVIFGYRW
jgi:hypothetical protein